MKWHLRFTDTDASRSKILSNVKEGMRVFKLILGNNPNSPGAFFETLLGRMDSLKMVKNHDLGRVR